MDLERYVRAVRRSWVLVLVVVLAGGAALYGYSKRQTPLYQSKLQFYVGSPAITDSSANSTNQFATDRATSYAELLSSDRLAGLVAQQPGVERPSKVVAKEVSGAAQLNTVLIDVVVRDPSPRQAYAIAAAVGTQFPRMIDALDTTGARTTGAAVKLSVVSGPTSSGVPVSPRTRLNVLIGLALGLLAGLALAVVRELMDVTVRNVDELSAVSGAAVLGSVAFDRSVASRPLTIDGLAYSARAEAMRQIRTNLRFADAAATARVIVLTSSIASEGKSTISANLALSLVESGQSVLLVEGDLRRPRLSQLLNVESSVGLTNVLASQVELDDVLQPWGEDGLFVLSSGTLPPNPAELLGGDGMRALMQQLRSRFDVVLIDSPPLLPVTDAALLAAISDGAIVVHRAGKTRRNQLRTALASLHAVQARVIGCVLNMKRMTRRERSTYESYYASEANVGEVQDARWWRSVATRRRRGPVPGTSGVRSERVGPSQGAVTPAPSGGARPDERSSDSAIEETHPSDGSGATAGGEASSLSSSADGEADGGVSTGNQSDARTDGARKADPDSVVDEGADLDDDADEDDEDRDDVVPGSARPRVTAGARPDGTSGPGKRQDSGTRYRRRRR